MTWKISFKLILFTTKFRCLKDRRRLPSRVCMHKCQPPHNNYYTPAGNQSRHGEERQVDKRLHIQKDIMGSLKCLVHCPNTFEKFECFCLMYDQHSDQLHKHISQANQDHTLKHNWQSMTALQNVKRHTHPTTCITTVRADLSFLKLSPGSLQRHNCSEWWCGVHHNKCYRCHTDSPAGKKYTLGVIVLKSVHKSITFSVISHHLLKEVHYNIQCTVFLDGILSFKWLQYFLGFDI
jgi:hypothetical protein